MVDKSKLRKTLLAMKRRIKKFRDLCSECHRRDRMDGISEGWLSNVEIYKFEKDMEELVEQALEDEKGNG